MKHPDGSECSEPNPRTYAKEWRAKLIETQTDHRSHGWRELEEYEKKHGVIVK